MQFESSGKWPADLEAVGALKAAFYLKIAAQLEESASIHAEVRVRVSVSVSVRVRVRVRVSP